MSFVSAHAGADLGMIYGGGGGGGRAPQGLRFEFEDDRLLRMFEYLKLKNYPKINTALSELFQPLSSFHINIALPYFN